MANISKKLSVIAIFATLLVAGFAAITVAPASAEACGTGYCYDYDYDYEPLNPYGSYIGNRFTYDRPSYINYHPQPIVIQQPEPIYIQQPSYTYVQPTPIVYNYPQYQYQQPNYNVQYYAPLTVSCSAQYLNGYNNSVTWTAYPSGGNGSYTYSWSGTDGLYGTSQTANYSYSTSGTKTATVTVWSAGQSMTQSCNNIAVNGNYYNGYSYNYQNVYSPTYVAPTYVAQNNQGLDVACYVDRTSAKADQPVNWTAEVVGGSAPYNYSWSGSESLSGNTSSVVKYYSTNGTKNAVVTVTSANGLTATKACTNTLAVGPIRSSAVASSQTSNSATNTVVAATSSSNTAASILSLSNVPWGWVAILIILVLFFTILYLLLNKQKI